ncbi:MAG: two-component regulator propeller domain-containing protein [Caldilineaceae bacterium]
MCTVCWRSGQARLPSDERRDLGGHRGAGLAARRPGAWGGHAFRCRTDANTRINAIHQDDDGILWLATDEGLLQFDQPPVPYGDVPVNPLMTLRNISVDGRGRLLARRRRTHPLRSATAPSRFDESFLTVCSPAAGLVSEPADRRPLHQRFAGVGVSAASTWSSCGCATTCRRWCSPSSISLVARAHRRR